MKTSARPSTAYALDASRGVFLFPSRFALSRSVICHNFIDYTGGHQSRWKRLTGLSPTVQAVSNEVTGAVVSGQGDKL